MALVPYPEVADMPEPYRTQAQSFKEEHGRYPWLRVMGSHFPPFLDAVDTMYPTFMREGRIDALTKELMFIACSEVRACQYCVGTHSRQLEQVMGMSRDAVTRARAGAVSDQLDERQHALIAFSRNAARDPAKIANADVQTLREAGLSNAEVVEAVSIVAFSAFTNAFADTLKLADDFEMMGIADEVF